MTNKEAINRIKEIIEEVKLCGVEQGNKDIEALNLAIEALKKYERPQDECANCHEWDCFGCKVLKRQEADNETD